jgi:hypothetical protein
MWDLFVQAAWKVAVVGLLFGAGLPAVFAIGVRLSAAATTDGEHATRAARAGYRTLGALCYAVAALAVGLGITVIATAGFGMTVSFQHVYPTLVPKS